MSKFTDLFEEFFESKLDEIIQGFPAKIDQFDSKTMRATIIPLLQTETSEGVFDWPAIADIPVLYINAGGYYIRPVYKKGDFVWVGWSTFDYNDALDEKTLPETDLKRSIGSAAVIGAIASDKFQPPAAFDDDGLLIGNGDDLIIQIKDDTILVKNKSGQFELKSSGQVDINGNFTVDP